ncbi:PREDICTED: FYN-binding protein isoform X1 [Cyprinodon variegatus]|uniref:FYN-binding protein isoform X1 n=1 Tax=Cyprinodon variegatus TaxID=28743 RepID=UPI000742A77A|nr:PREDICTED: FYN-binding protein isoform X1 [Cyprinodon variegatus]
MANKSDVKAIMARFQASGASVDDSTPVGRPKAPLQPVLSSGPAMQKKPVLESLSGGAINSPSKPPFLKSTQFTKSDSDAHEPSKTKALAGKFANSIDDTTITKPPVFNKVQTPLKPPFSQAAEAKVPLHKPPFNKPPLNSTMPETKPVFPKPPGALNSKPSWVKEDSGGGAATNTSPMPLKIPNSLQKPSSNVLKMKQQNEDQPETKTDTASKFPPQAKITPKPTNNFKNAQSLFNKEKDPSEQSESGGANKPSVSAMNSAFPPKPPANKKPSLKKPSKDPAKADGINGDIPPGLKRNPLPNSLALGPPPAKPNRPPKVDLQSFKRTAEAPTEGAAFKKSTVPAPLAPNLSNQTQNVPQSQAPPTLPPVLPARHVTTNQSDDTPPPPPPVFSHPSQRAKEELDDDEEMYEDLDDRWEEANQEKKKDDKEEKKRLEAAKKEQKEREKKEQEAKKKFKIDSMEVIQKGKAITDCKGSKMDLAVKQGDQLDIIRVGGNPEGKWLARSADGSFGYVKTTSVEIDFNSLKNRPAQPEFEPEIYDDIDVSPDTGSAKGPAVVLPPPPGEDGEIYDDVVDPHLEVSSFENQPSPARNRSFLRIFDRNRRSPSSKVLPAPDQFAAPGNSDRPGAPIDEEIYDDVDSPNAPPPPPISSLPVMKGKNKAEDMDPKKQKKFEKEEKEFRKKFKYEGEIKVLSQVTITSTLNVKKWSGKDLPVKAGEELDVIVKAQGDKLICRNEEGKFGYVSTSHVVDDGEIYDDIGGDDCIYDND